MRVTRSRTATLLRAALVAALVAVGALITVPIGPVPITLQVLVIAVAALVLSPVEALVALGLYAAIGAAGAPVFSGGGAGVGVLIGPTGGFIAGFVLGAPAAALVRSRVAGTPDASAATPRRRRLADISALGILLAVTYLAGWSWFALSTGRPAGEAFALAVAPFVLVDAAKCVAAALVARALRAAGLGHA
jgi:biotin transport system substrate-specific component